MSKIKIVHPLMIRVVYRQERTDEDYGSCIWADFDFDTINYTLKIMSDCGSYSYGWTPTPDSESFLHLCKRLDSDYLINKLADRTQIDDDATINNAINYFKNYVKGYELEKCNDWEDELKSGIRGCSSEIEVRDFLSEFCQTFGVPADDWDLWNMMEKGYTANAKKIVEVYINHIVPVITKEAQDERR